MASASSKDHAMRDSPDIPALKVEYDDDRSSRGMPSPLRTSQSASDNAAASANANAASYNTSYFVPQADSADVAMTDASDTTTTTDMAAPSKAAAASRKPKPAAASRPPAATARSRGGSSIGSNSRGGGSVRGGGAGARRGSSGKKKGSHLLKPHSGKSRSSPLSSSLHASASSSHKRGGTTAAASPSPSIKRESAAEDDDDNDDVDGSSSSDISSPQDSAKDSSDNDNEYASDGHPAHHHRRDGEISDDGPYCICRGPDDHRWMIQCDQCEDWFHGDCVKIDKEIGEHLVHSYICPNCTIPDGNRYVTRFRKMCSLPTCRKPARLYGVDGASAATPEEASYFCSDAHRDQWWDSLLNRVTRASNGSSGGAGAGAGALGSKAAESKMAVDLFTPAELLTLLASSDQHGVAEMLLHGLAAHNKNSDPDDLLTEEERAFTRKSASDRYHLAEQLVMCKKMLQLLDMAKARNYDAIKAGIIERDCCGYDDRLQHVAVQPHFERFLASPEGVAVFSAGRLGSPQFDENGDPLEAEGANKEEGDGMDTKPDGDNADTAADAANADSVVGMCRKRKCKAHLGWLPTLGRDVRMQMQDLTRHAAVLRDSETRIRLAAVQRAFVKQHTVSEVRYVGDSDNSLSSLAGSDRESDYDDDNDNDTEREQDGEDDKKAANGRMGRQGNGKNKTSDDDDDDDMADYESFQDAQSHQRYSSASAASSRRSRPVSRSRSRSQSAGYTNGHSNGYQRHRDRSYSQSREHSHADNQEDDRDKDAYRRRYHESSAAGGRHANGRRHPRTSNRDTPQSVGTFSD